MNSVDSFSIVALVMQADLVVKMVLLILFGSSVFSWMLIINKLALIRKQFKNIEDFEKVFFSGQVLDKVYERFCKDKGKNIVADIFSSGFMEFKNLSKDSDLISKSDAKDSIINAMNSQYNRGIQGLESDVDLIATIASASPFVGLLGTVWGIIDSFRAIAYTKNMSMLVVAPSIAEALFATALGLLVAIPALVFYNRISNNISRLSVRVSSFISDFSVILMRKM